MIQAVTRRALVTTAALGGGVAVMLAAAPAATAARPACTKIRQNQTLNAPVSWRYKELFSRVDQGVLRVRRGKDQTRVFGRLLIGGATCRRPGGSWIVINPIGLGYDSVGMDALGNVRSSGLMRGWGLGVRGGTGGSSPRINLQIMHCGRGNFFKTLKEIVGVPIPRVPFSFTTALWVAGQFLPADKVRCGNVGVKRLLVYATRTGELRLGDLTAGKCCAEVEQILNTNPNTPSGGESSTRAYTVGPITAKAG